MQPHYIRTSLVLINPLGEGSPPTTQTSLNPLSSKAIRGPKQESHVTGLFAWCEIKIIAVKLNLNLKYLVSTAIINSKTYGYNKLYLQVLLRKGFTLTIPHKDYPLVLMYPLGQGDPPYQPPRQGGYPPLPTPPTFLIPLYILFLHFYEYIYKYANKFFLKKINKSNLN